MIDARSQAEADRVFSPSDRVHAAHRLSLQVAAQKKRLSRNLRKAADAWSSWNSPIGAPQDLLDYEKHAEAAQLCSGIIDGLEGHIRSVRQ